MTRRADFRVGGRIPVIVTASLMSAAVAGCGDLFDVDNPGSITTPELDNPAFLEAMMHLAEAAAAESYDNWAQVSGLVGSDVSEPQTLIHLLWQDRGEIHRGPPFPGDEMYDALGAQTWTIRETRRRLEEGLADPEGHWALARSYFWDGVIQANRADFFEQITYDAGPPHTPVEVYEMALELLETAIPIAMRTGEANYIPAAYGTMARIERSLYFETGDIAHLAQAAQHAQQALSLDSRFRLDARMDPPQSNTFYGCCGPNSGLSVLGIEETFGDGWIDPVTGEEDPRIADIMLPLVSEGPAGPVYYQTKYEVNSPIPVSEWQEAVLIIAEHRLETGELEEAVGYINQVRTAANRPPFESTDPDRIREQLIFERRTEFFLEGRSWQDHRYYGIVPPRWTPLAIEMGLDRRFPVSQRELETNDNL